MNIIKIHYNKRRSEVRLLLYSSFSVTQRHFKSMAEWLLAVEQ